LFFEQLMMRTHPRTIVFRLSSVFGPGVARHPNAIFGMAKECIETKKLTVWGAGSRKMQYIHMADALTYICEANSAKAGIYNLGGDEYRSVAETAMRIAEFFGVEMILVRDKKEGETLPFMDTTKLKKEFGERMTPFDKSLTSYLNLVRATELA
jgi:nucleoside-diphosphate-sugar epimerase